MSSVLIAKAGVRVDGLALARAIDRLASSIEPQYRKAYLTAVKKAAHSPAMDAFVQRILSGQQYTFTPDLETGLAGISMDLSDLQHLAMQSYSGGAQAAEKVADFTLAFDITNPRALEYARFHSATLVKANQQTQEAIRNLVTKAYTDGIPPQQLAAMIQPVIGLLPHHAQAVYNYQQNLLSAGTAAGVAQKLAQSYADRLLLYRANNIARTEIIKAANQGQQDLWRQARDAGFINESGTQREWIAYGADKRTCAVCRSLNGKTAPMEGTFPVAANGVAYDLPPAHPSCRCSTGLVFEPGPEYFAQKAALKSELTRRGLPVAKFNPHHDRLGRFASGSGGGMTLMSESRTQQARERNAPELNESGILGLAPGDRWKYIKAHPEIQTNGDGGGVSESFWIKDPVTGEKMLVKDGAHFSQHDALSEVVASRMLEPTSLVSQHAEPATPPTHTESGWVIIPHLERHPSVKDAISVGWASPDKDITGSNMKLKMFDFVTLNSDRHSGNMFKITDRSGTYQAAAVDNSAVFGGRKKPIFQPENRPAHETMQAWRTDWNHPSNNDFKPAGMTAKYMGQKEAQKTYDSFVKEMRTGVAGMRDPGWLSQFPKSTQAKIKSWADYADARLDSLQKNRKANVKWLTSTDPVVTSHYKPKPKKPKWFDIFGGG